MTPESPAIIELAINGVTQPARNPHVPVTVEAIRNQAQGQTNLVIQELLDQVLPGNAARSGQ